MHVNAHDGNSREAGLTSNLPRGFAVRRAGMAESGRLTIGITTPDADGKTLNRDFDLMQSDGTTQHTQSTVVRDGDNVYWFTAFLQKGGEWKPEFKIRYERK